MMRTNISSGAPWEPLFGYSRAVRVGSVVYVSGTTATNAVGQLVGDGDAYAQATQALLNIERALIEAGCSMGHVVRTRIFVTNMDDWEQISRAHGAVFGSIRPAATIVEVRRLIDPRMLVEIEADAIVDDPAP